VSPIDDATGDNGNKHADDASSCRSDGDGMLNSADTSTAVGKKSSNWKLLKNGVSFHHTKKQAETNDNSETKTEDFNLINEAQKHAEVFKSRKRSTNESLTDGDTAAMKSDASASVDKSDDFLLKQMTSSL
jgi:predicted DNA binding CopG/RHH family protein